MPMPRRTTTEATISKESKGQMSSKKHKAAHADRAGGGSTAPATSPASSSATTSAGGGIPLDLQVIDDAFGKTADLYGDVLKVPTVATQEQIQLAYFDRRSELFTLLAKIDARPQSDAMAAQRYNAERRMDSVVLAVRILGDPALRSAYNRLRPERLKLPNSRSAAAAAARAPSPARAPSSNRWQLSQAAPATPAPAAGEKGGPAVVSPSPKGRDRRRAAAAAAATATTTEVQALAPPAVRTHPPPSLRMGADPSAGAAGSSRKDRAKKKKGPFPESAILRRGSSMSETSDNLTDEDGTARGFTGRGESAIEESSTMESRQEDDSRTNADTVDSASSAGNDATKTGSGVFSCFAASRTFKAITDEISGACEDTMVSVDQVFNAFTLTDKDIKAVSKKIDKAKRQLDS